jgi:hypothetical protein
MTTMSEAISGYEQELLQKADMLAMALAGLRAAAPERATAIVGEIRTRLDRAASRTAMAETSRAESEEAPPARPEGQRRPLVLAARGDDIEDFILDLLAVNPLGMSVQDIVDNLDAAQLEIKRKTLVVRLHRMVQAGRLSPHAHGHYTLSEAERGRRRA